MILKDSKPLIVTTKGTVIRGLKIKNPHGFSIIIKADNVTVQECDLEGSVNIFGKVKNTLIRNNYIHDIEPKGNNFFNKQFAGITTTEGDHYNNPIIQPLGAQNITIRGNYFANTPSAIYLVGCNGDIFIDGNYSFNHRGPFPRGQMCQLAYCNTTPETKIIIEKNFGYIDYDAPEQRDQDTDHRGAEDHINCNLSSGCKESPIIIRDNFLYGGSSSCSNSGIMAGDCGGGYYHILNNKVYYTENCGIGICGGAGNVIRGNTVFQDYCKTLIRRIDGRGIQIECYGDPFEGEILVEDNEVCFQTAKGDASLFCASDKTIFKNNHFYRNIKDFGPIDEIPKHEPPSAVEGLMRPWEQETEYDRV